MVNRNSRSRRFGMLGQVAILALVLLLIDMAGSSSVSLESIPFWLFLVLWSLLQVGTSVVLGLHWLHRRGSSLRMEILLSFGIGLPVLFCWDYLSFYLHDGVAGLVGLFWAPVSFAGMEDRGRVEGGIAGILARLTLAASLHTAVRIAVHYAARVSMSEIPVALDLRATDG